MTLGSLAAPAPGRVGVTADRTVDGSPARRLLSRRGLQRALGVLWLLDALLQLETPNFARDYPLGDLAQSVMGAPAWQNRAVFAGLAPFTAHWPWWNLASALLQGAIGVALLAGVGVRLALMASIAWSAAIWFLGEAMGMLPSGFAMAIFGAPGAAIMYAALSALAWPTGRRDVGTRPFAVVWSVYWIGAAVLQLPFVYSAGQTLRAGFSMSSDGQRSFLVDASNGVAHVANADPVLFSAVLGALQLAIGLGWLLDRDHARIWLGLGIAVSLAFWVVGQGLGGVLNWGATDPNTAPLVILLALVAWPRRTARHAVAAAPL